MTVTKDLPTILRLGAGALGLGTSLFGVAPLVAPRLFAKFFGLPFDDRRPAATMAIRSVGARDLVSGLGLLATMGNPARNRPWLLVRTAADVGDALVSYASLRGEPRNWRLRVLMLVAAGAALLDVGLLAGSAIAKRPGS